MKKTIWAIMVSVFVSSVAMAQNIMTLEQCIDSALNRNRNVKQQELNRKSREIAYEQARLNLLPNLNASAGQSFMFGRSLVADNTYQNLNSSQSSFNISSGVTLFDGMRMKYNIDARKAEMMASEADLDKIKADIKLNVTVAYLQVLLYKENLQTAESQIEMTLHRIAQKQALVDAGKVPAGEMFELRAQLAREEMTRIQTDNNLKLALLDLAQIIELDQFMELDVVMPQDLDTEPALLSVDEIFQSAAINRPEIKGAEYRLQSNEKNVDIARSAFYPTLSFGAQMGSGYYNLSGVPNKAFSQQISDNLSTNVGFSLQVPIFNKMENKNRVASSKLAVENSRIEIENTRMQLRKTIQQSYQSALAAQSRLNAARTSEDASREAYRFAELKYESGKASVYELYQAKTNLAQVISEVTQAKYEYALRIKMLELLR